MDDAAGDPDEYDDADSQANRNACRTGRHRRQQHERSMIAGDRTFRRRRPDGDDR